MVDALGGPIPDARVLLRHSRGVLQTALETRSDEDGRFELWAAPGAASIRAEATGYAPGRTSVVAPSEAISLQLTPGSTVHGRVLAWVSGKPVAGVEVRAMFEGRRTRSTAAISGEDGRFSLTGLEPGHHEPSQVGAASWAHLRALGVPPA